MNKFQLACMAIAFILAGLSAMMFWGQGFHTWCWQIICMIWIANSFAAEKKLAKFQTDKNSQKQ